MALRCLSFKISRFRGRFLTDVKYTPTAAVPARHPDFPHQSIEKPPQLSAAALVRVAFAAYTAATLLLGVFGLFLLLPPAGQNGPEQLADDRSKRQDEKSAGHRGVPRHDAGHG